MSADNDDLKVGQVEQTMSKARVRRTATQSPDTGDAPTNRGGAPVGNDNAMKHGLRAGKFPAGCHYLARQVATFKRAAEAATMESRGQLALYELALLQSATEHYAHGLRVRRWLRVGWDQLNSDQRLAYSREIGRAFVERDKVLKQLGIDANGTGAQETLYSLPLIVDDVDEPAPAPDAADGGNANDSQPTETPQVPIEPKASELV